MKYFIFLCSFFIFSLPAVATNCATYTDVNSNAWYCDTLEKLQEQKVLAKKSQFHPSQHMNRAEALKILYLLAGKDFYTNNSDFFDIQKDAWFKHYFYNAYAYKYIQSEGGNMNADQDITKSEFLILLMKIFELELQSVNCPEIEIASDWLYSDDFQSYLCNAKSLELATKNLDQSFIERAIAMQIIHNALFK